MLLDVGLIVCVGGRPGGHAGAQAGRRTDTSAAARVAEGAASRRAQPGAKDGTQQGRAGRADSENRLPNPPPAGPGRLVQAAGLLARGGTGVRTTA